MKITDVTPKKLKSLRERFGLSVGQFAKALGCSERYIAYRESGARPIKRLLALAVIGYETITKDKD